MRARRAPPHSRHSACCSGCVATLRMSGSRARSSLCNRLQAGGRHVVPPANASSTPGAGPPPDQIVRSHASYRQRGEYGSTLSGLPCTSLSMNRRCDCTRRSRLYVFKLMRRTLATHHTVARARVAIDRSMTPSQPITASASSAQAAGRPHRGRGPTRHLPRPSATRRLPVARAMRGGPIANRGAERMALSLSASISPPRRPTSTTAR